MSYLDQQSKNYLWSVIAFIVLTLGFQVSGWVHSHLPWWADRLLTGLLLGMTVAFAYVIFKRSIRMLRVRAFDDLGFNTWSRVLTIFLYFIIFVLGLAAWLVGWEGKNTGWVYGLGVFAGGFLIDAGIGSLLRSEDVSSSVTNTDA